LTIHIHLYLNYKQKPTIKTNLVKQDAHEMKFKEPK